LGVTEVDITKRPGAAASDAQRATPDAEAGVRPSIGRIATSLAIVGIVSIAVPLWVTHHYGAFGIVRNDDWSYLLTLFNWVDNGHLDFNSWVSMTLLAQLAFAAPIVAVFGRNIGYVQLETLVLGFAGLCAVEWLTFSVTRRLWKATFVAVVVACGPLWGPLAVSFMTDVPTFAVSMLAVALGARALRDQRVSMPFLVGSIAAGVAGFWIRQYAAVPLIAIMIAAAFQLRHESNRRRVWTFAVSVAAAVLAAGAFYAYWRTIPHPKAFSPSIPSGHSIKAVVYKGTGVVRLTGLLVLPLLVAAGPVRIVRRAWRTAADTTVFVGVGTAAILTFTAAAGPNIAFAGNYITPNGVLANGVAQGTRPDIFPAGVFSALIAIGTVGATLLALALVPMLHALPGRIAQRDLQVRDPVTFFLGLVVAGYSIAYFAAAITDIPLYDRYVLPVVPVIGVLLVRPAPLELETAHASTSARPRIAAAMIALVLLAFVGLVYTVDSAAFDGARWRAAVSATEQGWTRHQIQGGFEWTNFYAGTRFHNGVRYCVRIIVDPPGGIRTRGAIAHTTYRSPLRPAVPVVAVRTKRACTPGRKIQPHS
jgi:hypothetical protein